MTHPTAQVRASPHPCLSVLLLLFSLPSLVHSQGFSGKGTYRQSTAPKPVLPRKTYMRLMVSTV